MYAPYHAVASDIRDDYNTTFHNPYLDNYPYSHLSTDALHMPRKTLGLDDGGYGASGGFFDAQRVLDDDHFFQDAQNLSTSFRGIMQDVVPLAAKSERESEGEASSVASSRSPVRLAAVGSERSSVTGSETQELRREATKMSPRVFSAESREFVPKENPSNKEFAPKENTSNKEFMSKENTSNREYMPKENSSNREFAPKENTPNEQTPQSRTQSCAGDESMNLLSMGSFVKPHSRRRDDNFELFMDSNGIPDSMTDVMSPGLSFNMQWRDDGW